MKRNLHYPKCFDDRRQYQSWCILANASKLEGDKDGNNYSYSGYCIDCTPIYQLRMKKQGRCTHPKTEFYTRKFTQGRVTYFEIVGRRPAARTRAKVTKTTPGMLSLSLLPS